MGTFLETPRLILKFLSWTDLDDLIALRTDPEVMRYIGYSNPGDIQTPQQVERFLKMAIEYQEKYGFGFCAVFEKASGDFVGQAGLFHIGYDDKQPDIEIAYRLHKKFWGQGYATELVRGLIQWGFIHLHIHRLVAFVYPANIRSYRVLEKVGMTETGKACSGDEQLVCYEIYKSDCVELVTYQPQWPTMAEAEIQLLWQKLPAQHVLDIQHVGSTAIPGLSAKPVIDIQVAVDSLSAVKAKVITALKELGYSYWDKNPDLERMFFAKGMPPFGKKRTHHIHIVEPSSRHWREKMLFRDYLRTHPEAVREYEMLKTALAQQYTYDREQYTSAKTEFINKILIKAQYKS